MGRDSSLRRFHPRLEQQIPKYPSQRAGVVGQREQYRSLCWLRKCPRAWGRRTTKTRLIRRLYPQDYRQGWANPSTTWTGSLCARWRRSPARKPPGARPAAGESQAIREASGRWLTAASAGTGQSACGWEYTTLIASWRRFLRTKRAWMLGWGDRLWSGNVQHIVYHEEIESPAPRSPAGRFQAGITPSDTLAFRAPAAKAIPEVLMQGR